MSEIFLSVTFPFLSFDYYRLQNPSGYKMGTVKKKVDKPDRRNSVKRGKSFSLHYPNKYSTFDGRTPRGSKPSLAGLTLKSNSNLSGRSTPRATLPAGSPTSTRSPAILTPPASIADTENQSVTTNNSTPRSVSPTPTDTAPVNSSEVPYQSNNVKSEYANISSHAPKRSHSFSSSHKHESNAQVFDRTISKAAGMQQVELIQLTLRPNWLIYKLSLSKSCNHQPRVKLRGSMLLLLFVYIRICFSLLSFQNVLS